MLWNRIASRSPRLLRIVLISAIVVWAAALRMGSLVGPFGFGWQHLGAHYALIAQNFLHYGPLATRFAMVENAEVVPRDAWVYFTHHPPGMGLTTAALASVIGNGPVAVKLPGLLFALLQVVLSYILVARALSIRAGLAAAFVTAVMPAGAYFSTHGSDLGPQSIALALLALLLDERARTRNPDRPACGLVLLAIAASLFFDWPVLVISGFIAVRDLIGKRWKRALLFAGIVPAAFALHLWHVRFATGSFGGGRGGSLLDSFTSHGVVGAESFLGGFDESLITRRLLGHVRFLFGDAGLAVAALGLLLGTFVAPFLRNEETRLGPRARATNLGLAALALLYSLPFARAVVVHRFWLIVALPWIAFLCGLAVHSTGNSRISRWTWLAAAITFGIWQTWHVVDLQQKDRTPYYEELGTALHQHVPPGQRVLTTERVSACLLFYAGREIKGNFGDKDLTPFLAAEKAVALPKSGWFAALQPSVDPPRAQCTQLVEFLDRRWEPVTISLPLTGTTLLLFDFARRRTADGTTPKESGH